MPCPDATELKQLLDDTLPAPVHADLSQHLEACPTCRSALDQLATDGASVSGLARGLGRPPTEAEPGLQRVLQEAAHTEASEDITQAPQAGTEDLFVTQAPGVLTEDLAFLSAVTEPGQPARLEHYVIKGVIGKGGFGVVLKAFDEKLHRMVAIKALAPAYAAVGSARKRFIREARASAAVKNEHVVAIYDVQAEKQQPYLVMELIEGQSLQDKLDKHGPLGVKEILRIGMQAAEGLAAAHRQGLVHRDIKPANILLENGVERVKITDFGLARAVDDASMTQSGTVAGTPMYMSPEQASGIAIDHRSDLFSLGTVLYSMATGHPPFRATGTHAVLMRVIEDTPRPIREINPELPEWLEAIIAKLHAKKPEDRFQTAKEVAELLRQHLAHIQEPSQAPMPAPVVLPAKALSAGTSQTLLEGSDRTRRLLQHGLSTAVLLLGLTGILLLFVGPTELRWPAIADLVAAAILLVGVARIKQRWSAEYRGHQIRFENSCVTGESLFIDDVRVARGGVGLRNEIRAMIQHGEGAGEEVVVFAESGLFSFHCRIVVEHSPSPERSARLAFAARVQRWLAAGVGVAAVAMVVVAVSLATWWNHRTYVVTFQMDDPDIIVRIWPTAQKTPPVNLAGGFEIFGNPTYVITNTRESVQFLPAGHYWLTAELGDIEVERIFFHVLSDSLETHHIEVVGNNVSAVGNTVVGLPKVVNVPGAARFVQKEKNRLQGAWRGVAAVMDGQPMTKEMIAQVKPRIFFDGDRITMVQNMPGQEKMEQTYTLDPRKKPSTLDIPKGFNDGQNMLAIYRWDGPNALTICAGPNERPTSFESVPGSKRVLFTLFRESGVTAPDWLPIPTLPFDAAKAKQHQKEWANHLGVDVEVSNSLDMKLRLIPPGEFAMTPDYKVRITKPYRMAATEVTVGQFRAFVKEMDYKTYAESSGKGATDQVGKDPKNVWHNPLFAPSEQHPVGCLDWNDAVKFCEWLSRKEKKVYRLPTEAEWEWACRAGSTTHYWGDDPKLYDEYEWPQMTNAKVGTVASHPVGLKKPNPWGLYDLYGNVVEFCQDVLANFPKGTVTDPRGPVGGPADMHVIRGVGSSAEYRFHGGATHAFFHFGFRVVCEDVSAEEGGPWVQLFNGKNLDGWVAPQPGSGEWHVDESGRLVGKGNPRSYLFTQRDDFTDFHLRAELQVGGGSAGGICFRSGLNRLPTQLAPGYKASLSSDPPIGSLLLTRPEDKSGEFVAKASKTDFNPSTWFTMEVIARGNHLTVKIDGKSVADYTDVRATYTTGRIALETYLPGTSITFKKVEIKELPPEEPGWVQLFNGTDLTNWKPHPNWRVENNLLIASGPLDKARGASIGTQRNDFADFHLRVEARVLTPAADSGVFVRIGNKSWCEANICCDPKNKDKHTGSIHIQKVDNKPFPGWISAPPDLTKPNEWMTLEIIASGQHVITKVNGKQTAEIHDAEINTQGPILLQQYGEQTVVQFKKVEIKELPPTPARPQLVVAGVPRKTIDNQSFVRALAFTADSSAVIAGGNALSFFDAQRGDLLQQEKLDGNVTAPFSLSGDRKTLALVHKDAAVIFDLPLRKVPLQSKSGFVFSAALSPDGKTLVYSADKTLWVHDRTTGKTEPEDRHGFVGNLKFSPDARFLIGVSQGMAGKEQLLILDAKTRDLIAKKTIGIAGMTDISADSKRIVVTGIDEGAPAFFVFSLPDHQLEYKQANLERTPVSVAFHPDGNHLALGMIGQAQIWDLVERKEVASWPTGPPDKSHATIVAFAPDGKTLVTGSGPSIQLWNLAPPESEWISLFGGKELTEWQALDPETAGAWKIEDGVLVGRSKSSYKGGIHFKTVREFPSEFHLRMEVKASNAGTPMIAYAGGQNQGFRVHLSGNEKGTATPGTVILYKNNLVINKAPAGLVKPGDWYRLEIICYRNRLRVRLNDQNLGDHAVPGGIEKRGHVGLFCAGTATLSVRSIEIKEIKEPPDEPGWVPLFNGTDLTGWLGDTQPPPIDPTTQWTIKDGTLQTKKDREDAFLHTAKAYENYILEFEFNRIGKDLGQQSSGLLFHLAKAGTPSTEALVLPLTNLRESPVVTRGKAKGAWEPGSGEWKAKPLNEWNRVVVTSRNGSLHLQLNGVDVGQMVGCEPRRGFIGIQMQTNSLLLRNIRIKELPASQPTLPKKAADIPAFVAGTWKVESTIVEPKLPPAQAKMTGIMVDELIAGGKFLRSYANYGNGQFEALMVQQYDTAIDTVKGWFFGSKGENHGPGVGRWNADTRTMLWLEKLPSGLQAAYSFEFTDVNTINTRVYYQNDKNDIVFELKGKATRLAGPVELKPAPIDPNRPPEMKIFDDFIGEWDTAGTMKTKEMPAGFKFTTNLRSQSILGGRVVETKETGLPGQDDLYWLMTYDANLKAYRSWLFNGAGHVMSLGGQWDEKSGTLKWNEAKPDGSVAASTWKMVNPDRWEWTTTIKDAVGNTLFDLAATKTRKLAPGKKPRVPAEELPPKVRDAVNKGLDYLVKTQHKDGHWEGEKGAHPTSLTALAGMTMLMEGSTLQDGKYADSLLRAVDWMTAQSQANGLLSTPDEKGMYMFGHGYGMLFLASVYKQEPEGDRRQMLAKILTKAVDFAAKSQTKNGGWGYVMGIHANHFDESAATVCVLQALRASRNAGIDVPRGLIDADYLRKCTTTKGGVLYSITEAKGGERPALTAAALAAGEYDSELARKWLKYCQGTILAAAPNTLGYEEYMHYHFAQALYILGEKGYEKLFPGAKPAEQLTWSGYRAKMFDAILARQRADGGWDCPNVGAVYGTVSWLTVLQLDRGFVPIYQR